MKRKFIGWSGARNRWGDPTGIAHAVVAWPDGVARNACGSRVPTYGQVDRNVTDAAPHACQRCVKAVLGANVEALSR